MPEIMRGSKVKIHQSKGNVKIQKSLIGKKGIALARMRSGYIKVLQEYEGELIDSCYPEDCIEVLEQPIKL